MNCFIDYKIPRLGNLTIKKVWIATVKKIGPEIGLNYVNIEEKYI